MSKAAQQILKLLKSYRKNHPDALMEALRVLIIDDGRIGK